MRSWKGKEHWEIDLCRYANKQDLRSYDQSDHTLKCEVEIVEEHARQWYVEKRVLHSYVHYELTLKRNTGPPENIDLHWYDQQKELHAYAWRLSGERGD